MSRNRFSDEVAILEDQNEPMDQDDPFEFDRDVHSEMEAYWRDNDANDVYNLVDLEPPFGDCGEPEYDFGDGYS